MPEFHVQDFVEDVRAGSKAASGRRLPRPVIGWKAVLSGAATCLGALRIGRTEARNHIRRSVAGGIRGECRLEESRRNLSKTVSIS